MSWLLILQLPLVKMYNSAVYERIITRLYWRLANDPVLLAAAIASHNTGTASFVKEDFKYLHTYSESVSATMQLMYPRLTSFCPSESTIRVYAPWSEKHKKVLFTAGNDESVLAFGTLAWQQLYHVVPAARNHNSLVSTELYQHVYLDLDLADYQPTTSTPTSTGIYADILEDLSTYSLYTDPVTDQLAYNTAGIDFSYFHEPDEGIRSQRRNAVISRVLDHALLTQLRRNDCFNRHVRFSLSGILGLDSKDTRRLNENLNDALRGWELKKKHEPFYYSLDPNIIGKVDCTSVSWGLLESTNSSYSDNMGRWLITFSLDSLLDKTSYPDIVKKTPLALNLTIPALPYLIEHVWKTNDLYYYQNRISASFLTSPSARRDDGPYFSSYIANLATAISEYFHSVSVFSQIYGGATNVTRLSVDTSLSVPILRLLCDVGLMGVPTSLSHKGQIDSCVPVDKDILLIHTPRLLRYLSEDGYLGMMVQGISSTFNLDTFRPEHTTCYTFGWTKDSLPSYRKRLNRLHTHVMPIIFGGVENTGKVSPLVNSSIITPLPSRDYYNDLWRTAEPPFEHSDRFLVLYTPKLYRYCRHNCASNIGSTRMTFATYIDNRKPKKVEGKNQLQKKRVSCAHVYDVHELTHILPLGRVFKVKLVRKGFDVFVSIPWEDLYAWYGILPPSIGKAYRSSNMNRCTLTTKINTFAACKKSGWGLYHEYRERLIGNREGSPTTLFDEWDVSYEKEYSRLNPNTVKLFKGIGFVFHFKTLLSASGSWDFGIKPVDRIPGWEDLIVSWSNYPFALNNQLKSSTNKKAVKDCLSNSYIAEYEANLKLPKRQRKDMRIRFSEEEDAAILKYYRRDMSLEDEKMLRETCHRHDYFGVACRANKLAEKLIKEHGITDVTRLPIKRVGKNLRVMLKAFSGY
jgi:hypothetical protein